MREPSALPPAKARRASPPMPLGRSDPSPGPKNLDLAFAFRTLAGIAVAGAATHRPISHIKTRKLAILGVSGPPPGPRGLLGSGGALVGNAIEIEINSAMSH